jgi:NAD(P)-dependent dehydrogenase (short-subunit alcohol dehydrogenase family)
MAATDATRILRAGLLEGITMLLARAGEGAAAHGSPGQAVGAACSALGAHVIELQAIHDGSQLGIDEPDIEAEVERALAVTGTIDLVVIDTAALYGASRGASGELQGAAALQACLESSWKVTRAVANRAFLAPARPGRIVLIAPAPGAGEHARAAGAGLENLARTLSTEWASHLVTAVTIAPGDATTADELATVVAYLACLAGAYFSGCLLDLRGPARDC